MNAIARTALQGDEVELEYRGSRYRRCGRRLRAHVADGGAGSTERPGESRPGRTGAESEFVVSDHASTRERRETFVITYSDGGRSRTLSTDGLADRDLPFPSTPVIATRSEGTLTLRVTLMREGRAVASQEVSVPLKRDWIWGFGLHLKPGDPNQGCFGCVGYVSAPLPAAEQSVPGEMFHISWGGNYISNPAVF